MLLTIPVEGERSEHLSSGKKSPSSLSPMEKEKSSLLTGSDGGKSSSVKKGGSEIGKRKWDDSIPDVECDPWKKKIKEDATILSVIEQKPPSRSTTETQSALDTVKKLHLQEPWRDESITSEIKIENSTIFPALCDVLNSNIYMLGEKMKFEYKNIMKAATRFYHLQYVRDQLIISLASLNAMKTARILRNSECRCGCQGQRE